MRDSRILIDIGSTFTKAVAVDLSGEAIVAAARAPTTASTDVRIGIDAALQRLDAALGAAGGLDGRAAIACSSAAGGLRMISIGLVPELSAEAARRAALGAGAKIVGHYGHELTRREVDAIVAAQPDIVLLAGGTDGGNRRAIVHNATRLAQARLRAPVVVAGNKSAQDEVQAILQGADVACRVVDNVMPQIGVLEVEACRRAIRGVFIDNIVKAKGLDEARERIGAVVMPTPVAVLEAARLLGDGTDGESGLGDLVVVDVGGATTDVYSIARGLPTRSSVALRGLPEPFAKRTVEGDLGVRHNIDTLLELSRRLGETVDDAGVAPFLAAPQRLPLDDAERRIDARLAAVAVRVSFERHVGRVETVYGAHGATQVQTGKDLTRVATVVGTGGPLAHADDPRALLAGVFAGAAGGELLKPVDAAVRIDADYVMFAMGLLARSHPAVALRLLKRHLRPA